MGSLNEIGSIESIGADNNNNIIMVNNYQKQINDSTTINSLNPA